MTSNADQPSKPFGVEGTRRLDEALAALAYSRDVDNHFRGELLTSIRKFAVMTGDNELEEACDRRLETLPVDGRHG